MAFLEVSEGKRIYFEYNPGPRATVVLVHGWGMQCRVWDGVLVGLQAAGYGVISFDQRGCGQSDKDFAEVSIAASAGDAIQIMDHLGVQRAVFNGWSICGAVSVAAAHQLGARCQGLISTVGATPRFTQAPDFPYGAPAGAVAGMVEQLRADRASFLHGLNQNVYALPVSEAVKTWTWQMFMQTSPCADLALLDLGEIDQRALLHGLEIPLLAIVGARDQIVAPDIVRHAAALAPQGRAVEFAESGHAPFLEEPARYVATVLEFLNSLTPRH